MPEIYESVKNSLYHVCKVFSQDMQTLAVTTTPLEIYNFDGFSQTNKLPAGGFIGLRDFSVKVDTKLAWINVMFGISTVDDPNLFQLDKLTGKLLMRVLPDMKLSIYDSAAPSTRIGYMQIAAGTDVSPVYTAQQRPLKLIHVSGGLSLATQPG